MESKTISSKLILAPGCNDISEEEIDFLAKMFYPLIAEKVEEKRKLCPKLDEEELAML